MTFEFVLRICGKGLERNYRVRFGKIESYSLVGQFGTRVVQLLVWRLVAGLRPPGDSHQYRGPLE